MYTCWTRYSRGCTVLITQLTIQYSMSFSWIQRPTAQLIASWGRCYYSCFVAEFVRIRMLLRD